MSRVRNHRIGTCMSCKNERGICGRRLCVICYKRHRRAGTLETFETIGESKPLGERFAAYVIPEPNSGCFLWIGAHDARNYGRIGIGSRGSGTMLAHRAAWELAKGSVPADLCVLHRCDNPACVNVAHLFLGTRIDNNADCKAKGRQKGVKLTPDQIREILTSTETRRSLAMKYGITKAIVDNVASGKSHRIGVRP